MCIFCPDQDDLDYFEVDTDSTPWPTPNRLIDQLPSPTSPPEIQLLVLGLPRTGLTSLRHALTALDYDCYSPATLDAHPSHYAYWEEALRAKYLDDGAPFTRADYAKLLAPHTACIDAPCAFLAADLIAAFPRARVVLTRCDPDAWARYTLHHHQMVDSSLDWRSFDWVPRSPWDLARVAGPWAKFRRFERFLRPLLAPRGEREAFLDHYDEVRELVPEERLLEYSRLARLGG
ncbi:hypothetical protein SLS58_007775 [Diplodia intermedia]|uniref:Nad dependent epimerase n=1 Tax=Diplodia intermedia TaxID=856260 RepID=A0ABR3TJ55_9PEZI